MKNESHEDHSLDSFRLQIGEIINEAVIAGLHNIPYQTYDAFQNGVKETIIRKFIDLERRLIECCLLEERAYLSFDKLLSKFINREATPENVAELFLNTDASLIQRNIPPDIKILQALQLLQEKVSQCKMTLLDIYYIHRTVELEGYRIGWWIPTEITNQLCTVIDKYFSVNTSYATSEAYYLLKQISDAKNFDDAYYLYYNNLDILLDVTFIKVNDGQEGTFVPTELYQPFLSVKDISENLYSPFFGGKVNFASGTITQRVKNTSMTQRNVSLDVNTVSYIRTMADGHSEKLPSDHIKNLIQNIDVIIKKASSFDYLPYILENFIFTPGNEERILKTVKSVEHFLYPENELKCLRYYEIVKSTFNDKPRIERVKQEYYIGYALLLLICFINFKFNKMKTLQKLENFCLYMDRMFFLFREPFVEIAFNFFEYRNQYRFFKKIQVNAKNILKDLKNMAWDVFHLWHLEAGCSIGDMGADLVVPYFYCFDKGLLELKECFDLETLFVNQRTGERICFYHKHSYPLDIIENYMSIEREKVRRERFSHDNIMMQIEYLEKEISALW